MGVCLGGVVRQGGRQCQLLMTITSLIIVRFEKFENVVADEFPLFSIALRPDNEKQWGTQ